MKPVDGRPFKVQLQSVKTSMMYMYNDNRKQNMYSYLSKLLCLSGTVNCSERL